MSIIEIRFHLIKCLPAINYTNYSYTIYCEETKFSDTITFQAHNTIADTVSFKTDLKYSIKAYDKGSLIGITSFELPNSLFYRKETKCLKELRLTIPDKVKQALIKETSQSQMSVKIMITFNYTERKIGYKQRQLSLDNKTIQKTEASIVKYKSQANQLAFKTEPKSNMVNMTASFKKMNTVTPTKMSKTINKTINKTISVKNDPIETEFFSEENLIFSSNDNSVIDSLLGRDDASFGSADELEEQKIIIERPKSIKKKISFEPKIEDAKVKEKEKDNGEPYTQKEMEEIMLKMILDFSYNYKIKALKLKKEMEDEERIRECFRLYDEKKRNLLKKEHKLMQSNNIYDMKKDVMPLLKKERRDIKQEAIASKKMELDLCYGLLKHLGMRKREDDMYIDNNTEKDFVIKVFNKVIKANQDFIAAVNDDKRESILKICEAYNIKVDSKVNNGEM